MRNFVLLFRYDTNGSSLSLARKATTRMILLLFTIILLMAPTSKTMVQGKRIRKDNEPTARRFSVRNLSSVPINVYWINLTTEERILQFDLVPGATNRLNSHVGHEFEIREQEQSEEKDEATKGTCGGRNGKCRKKYFQITQDEDQVFTITTDFKIEISNSRTRANEKAKTALQQCRNDVSKYAVGDNSLSSSFHQLDKLAECITTSIHESIYETREELDFQAEIRRKLGSKLQVYACNDPYFPSTEPILSKEWDPTNSRIAINSDNDNDDEKNHTVKVMLQADTTMIAVIENIVKPTDCGYMQQFALMNDSDPEKEEEKGNKQLKRNMNSAVPWESRKESVTIDFLSRIYAYTNPAVKLMNYYAGLPEKGQDLFHIYHDSSDYYYHVDDNDEQQQQQQTIGIDDVWPVDSPVFARLLMFCEVPEENGGGAIHFPESGVHIHPNVGEAVLITYTKPPEGQGQTERFVNEHVYCPIIQGKRTILQHQFRLYPNTRT